MSLPLMKPTKLMIKSTLKNNYLLMRHGESEANEKGIIVSDPKNGCDRFGLTKQGAKQVIASVQGFKGEPITHIVCSDFLRTLQTAQVAAKTLKLPQPQQEQGLRERFFGDWEGMSAEHYQNIWRHDDMNELPDNGVEPPEAVLQRGLKVLQRLEQQYQRQVILLVSHGDMLQILSTAFASVSPQKHRSLPHHQTAQIKGLVSRNK